MATWTVTEVVTYEVEADSEEEACQLIIDDPKRDERCIGVEDRYATLLEGD